MTDATPEPRAASATTDATPEMPVPRTPPAPPPLSTYRLQLTPDFGFDDVAAVAPYLADLGVSHAYLSPILEAVSGSTHGYDVVDHSRLRSELGGAAAFERMRAALGVAGLGVIVDIVPNHMAVPTPASANAQLWSVLREGPASPYARWFDVDWSIAERAVMMPVLGARIGDAVAAGEITLDRSGPEPVVRYFDHTFPVRPGTVDLPLPQLLDRQWYRLAYWRVADEELNYRRFFDIGTLAAIRVEDEAVFAATHRLLLGLLAEGGIDGLRIDHPDGLADPRGYLRRLATATGGAWVVVEKILEGSEELPADWDCAGTSGYDALAWVGGLFVDPEGAGPLRSLYAGISDQPAEFAAVSAETKRQVVEGSLRAEVARLVDTLVTICHGDLALRDHTSRSLDECLVEMLVAFSAYRAYVVPGEEPDPAAVHRVEEAVASARAVLPEHRHPTLDVVRDLALGRHGRSPAKDEFVVRFQQTTGPVMAKGVEDTAFYRWLRLAALNEVGGDPERFGVIPAEFHARSSRLQETRPTSMTTLSTHDTKRSEDVRARLSVLSELPDEWALALSGWRSAAAAYRPNLVDANTEYLLWQTLVGAWPIGGERLWPYVEKAIREAKVQTSWTAPDVAYESTLREFVDAVLADDVVMTGVRSFVEQIAPHARVNILGQKLVQLTMPGVPDVYQGTELTSFVLVDPDNRRPADYDVRRRLLAHVGAGLDDALDDTGPLPTVNDADDLETSLLAESMAALDREKLLLTTTALRLRREHPDWFGPAGAYAPVEVGTPHAVAFTRAGEVVTVATRLSAGLAASGGFGDVTIQLPPGAWTDRLTGRTYAGGEVGLADVLQVLPVALLTRP